MLPYHHWMMVSQTKMNREIRELRDAMSQMDLRTSIEHSIQTEMNIPSSQHFMKPSQKLTTYLVTKKPQQIQKKWNNSMYLIKSPWFKTRSKQQY